MSTPNLQPQCSDYLPSQRLSRWWGPETRTLTSSMWSNSWPQRRYQDFHQEEASPASESPKYTDMFTEESEIFLMCCHCFYLCRRDCIISAYQKHAMTLRSQEPMVRHLRHSHDFLSRCNNFDHWLLSRRKAINRFYHLRCRYAAGVMSRKHSEMSEKCRHRWWFSKAKQNRKSQCAEKMKLYEESAAT